MTRFGGFATALILLSCRRAADEKQAAGTSAPPAPTDAIVFHPPRNADSGNSAKASPPEAPAPQRPGMVWIPPGTLEAGTPPDRVPRVADEEPPGIPVEMTGFYIDSLPFPNESGAIPTTNVTRDEAEQRCTAKGKRLCTQLEWERACKGPENTAYEYGNTYRAAVCGTGLSADEAAHRPSGERAACKSAFGVADMHGGAWEWTASPWFRSAGASHAASAASAAGGSKTLGVLRGGNTSAAGELVARCANAIARPPSKRSPNHGFRCCAGPSNSNEASVALDIRNARALGISRVGAPESLRAMWEPVFLSNWRAAVQRFERAWRWTPVPNEELVMVLGCDSVANHEAPTCDLAIGRQIGDRPSFVTLAELGRAKVPPDITRGSDARHIHLRGFDLGGTFGRDFTYVYGRVEVGRESRP